MDQPITGPVRMVAPYWTRTLPGAFCRKLAGAVALAVVLAGCQPGTEPIDGTGTGTLFVVVSGLPDGGAAAVTVTGGSGYQQTLSGSETLTELVAGSYTVTAEPVTVSGDRYAPGVPSQTVAIVAHNPPASVSIGYGATTGRLQLTIAGVPSGATAAVQVTGPGGYSRGVTDSELITGLSPGEYLVSSSLVILSGLSYLAVPSNQVVTVSAGAAAAAAVAYFPSTGGLAVTITGLPEGVAPLVTVTGPGGFTQSLGTSTTLTGLSAGSYNVSAAPVSAGANYNPNPPNQTINVMAGAVTSALVEYSSTQGGATLDLRVDGVYLTQAVQRYDGSVPLVAGRDAYFRAFAVANSGNSAQPQVRVRLYQGTTLVQTSTINSPSGAVPTAANEGTVTSSWNVLVPGALVQAGLRVMADVDPGNAVAEADETNNQFPLAGQPAPVDVRGLPTFAMRFVPVLQQVNGLVGNVTAANLESFLADLKMVLPVGAYEADVRAVYTTTAPVLQSNNANNAWTTILNEVLALRYADASTRYYYGVVQTTYGSGTAGMGYVGGSARTAIGWDYLPSGSRVMAHELGHNMGRQHAPCGSVLGPDPSYPYSGGTIGVWGLQLTGLVPKAPSTPDLMGYCQPTWVSDYNWSAMVGYRQGEPPGGAGGAGGQGGSGAEGLLVWGRITPDGVVLEPAFRVPAGAGAAPGGGGGTNQVELLRDDGSVIRSARFEAVEIADLPGGPERHFALVLPLGAEPAAVGGVRVRAEGRVAVRQSRVALPGQSIDPEPRVSRAGADRVALRWNADRYPMVLVRDAATGRVLSFARGGNVALWARGGGPGQDFDLQFSDGVRTTTRREKVLR